MFAIAVVTCLILIFTLLYSLRIIAKNAIINYNVLKKIPGPPRTNFIVGNVKEFFATPDIIFKKLREFARDYYPIYNVNVFNVIGPCLLHPDDFELILSSSKHTEKSVIYNILHNWLGTGLLTSNGQKWMTRRRILTPAFHFSILQEFLSIFNEETKTFVETIKTLNEDVVNVDSHIMQFTLKTIAETAMGSKLEFKTNKEKSYRQAIKDIGEIVAYRITHTWFAINFINIFSPKYLKERKTTKILQEFTREVVLNREKSLENFDAAPNHEVYKRKKRLAMLDLLLRAKNEEKIIDYNGVCEEVDTFMFEGHDTTGAALGFALMLIACHRNVQDLIVEEIKNVVGDDRQPTFGDLQDMKYLERVIKEVLRLYPSVHFISRKLGEEVITTTGYKLPKDTFVHLHIFDLHRNPEFYPEPEKFDPDRFLPENSKDRHLFAYLPFSAGPRNCIGQKFAMLELKAALCGILRNFILKPVDTPETIVLVIDIVLRTKDGIKVKFVPR